MIYIAAVSDQILERIQGDTRAAMKAGDKQRTSALRMIASAVQKAAKDGDDDAVAVLQRERKKRKEAAEAFAKADRTEQAEAEREEAELISGYLPEELSDEELGEIVERVIADTGAEQMQQMGQVMGAAMAEVKGRADGNRVSALVREKLAGGA